MGKQNILKQEADMGGKEVKKSRRRQRKKQEVGSKGEDGGVNQKAVRWKITKEVEKEMRRKERGHVIVQYGTKEILLS